ncbi:MAG: hypothetical protein J5994_04815 [Ruminococcus sp.]|nr:hypothetical protein [Ruminococcus sp.]
MRFVRSENRKSGFFAFLCGAALMGVLLGTVSYCCSDGVFLQKLGLAQSDFIRSRMAMDYASLMAGSLWRTSLFIAAAFVCGLCAVGQPAAIALLVFRGMGLGLTMAQLYSTYGSSGILPAAGLILPGAVISTLAIVTAVRESVSLSNILLRISLSERQENGLLEPVKLYAAKFMVLEAAIAVSAGADCICNYIFIGYF